MYESYEDAFPTWGVAKGFEPQPIVGNREKIKITEQDYPGLLHSFEFSRQGQPPVDELTGHMRALKKYLRQTGGTGPNILSDFIGYPTQEDSPVLENIKKYSPDAILRRLQFPKDPLLDARLTVRDTAARHPLTVADNYVKDYFKRGDFLVPEDTPGLWMGTAVDPLETIGGPADNEIIIDSLPVESPEDYLNLDKNPLHTKNWIPPSLVQQLQSFQRPMGVSGGERNRDILSQMDEIPVEEDLIKKLNRAYKEKTMNKFLQDEADYQGIEPSFTESSKKYSPSRGLTSNIEQTLTGYNPDIIEPMASMVGTEMAGRNKNKIEKILQTLSNQNVYEPHFKTPRPSPQFPELAQFGDVQSPIITGTQPFVGRQNSILNNILEDRQNIVGKLESMRMPPNMLAEAEYILRQLFKGLK